MPRQTTPTPLDPVYPVNFVKEYRRLLIAALRRWYNQAIGLIKAYLVHYRDSLLDDLFNRVRQAWDVEVAGLRDQIRDLYRRVSQAHFTRWLTTLAAATGVTVAALTSLITEPWLREEEDSRVQANVAQAAVIGGTLALALETTLRNGLRSGLRNGVISSALRAAYDLAETRAGSYAANQIEEHWSAVTQQRQQAAGSDGYIWQLTSSAHPRKHHLLRVGHFYRWDTPPDDGHPGQAIHCKCGAKPALGVTAHGIPVLERYRHESQSYRRA